MLATLEAGDELFHTAVGTAYADLQIDGHRETWPIHSKRFRSWLRRRYYHATGNAPSAAALNAALNLLEAGRSSRAPSGWSMSAPPNRTGTSTSISPTPPGGR